MTVNRGTPDFSELFNRAVAACAQVQRLVSFSARTEKRARASRLNPAKLRRIAVQIRDVWLVADAVHALLRNEVERIARMMRAAGVDDRAAIETVRSHIRFVLYDGGLAEQDAEPVVARASLWVEQVYAAA